MGLAGLHARYESGDRLKRKLVEESLASVERGRCKGRYGVDAMAPDAVADELRQVIDEAVRHASCRSLGGTEEIPIVLEVSAESSDGAPRTAARTVRGNRSVFGLVGSDCEDVEW